MDISKLIQEGGNITIAVSLSDLEAYSESLIEKTKNQLDEEVKAANAEAYLTIEEVTDKLGVDRSTLWRWNKTGYLKAASIGGKRRYLKSKVEELLNGGR